MTPDFIQIGFQKCGTTFLENNVYPTNLNLNVVQAAKHTDLELTLLKQIILPDRLEFDRSYTQYLFNKSYSPFYQKSKTNGIMFEGFTFLYERRFDRKSVVERLKSLFPESKIITFIRSQKTWLLSHYSQYIKSGGLLNLNDFIELQLDNPSLDSHYIDWYPLIKCLHEIFGKKNVLVCLFEDLKIDPQKISNNIFSFLDVPYSIVDNKKVNVSLSKYSLYIIRIFNHVIRHDLGESNYMFNKYSSSSYLSKYNKMKKTLIYNYYKIYLNYFCEIPDKFFNLKKKQSLNQKQLEKINLLYGKNNKKLFELLNIDGSQYNYPQ